MIYTVLCETCPRVRGWPITYIHRTPEARDTWADWHMFHGHVIRTDEREETT